MDQIALIFSELGDIPAIVPSGHDAFVVFLVAYPFVTCLLWSLSALTYVAARLFSGQGETVTDISYSVLIPFHNEPQAAIAAARSLIGVTPAPREIILIDDGSPLSGAAAALDLPPLTRIVRLADNVGKAKALQAVLPLVSTDVTVCMDADTITRTRDWSAMLSAFRDQRLGAVTGKITPADTRGLVRGFQGLDYLSVIMLIKAAESQWGGLMTVSGAFVAYRTEALRAVGGWSSASAAEDIDLSWRLQLAGWRLAFVSRWNAEVEMAPNFAALWRQRRRWSSGLGRAIRDYGFVSLASAARHAPVAILTMASLVWITSILALGAMTFLKLLDWHILFETLHMEHFDRFFFAAFAAYFSQFLCALSVDAGNPLRHWKSALLVPLYPLYFWVVLITSFIAGFPQGFLRADGGLWARTVRLSEQGSEA